MFTVKQHSSPEAKTKRPVLVHEERISRHWRDSFFVPSTYAEERSLSPRLQSTRGQRASSSRPQSASWRRYNHQDEKEKEEQEERARGEHPWYLAAARTGSKGTTARGNGLRPLSASAGPRSPEGPAETRKKPAYKTPGVAARTGFRVPPEPSTYPELPYYREREGRLPYEIPPEARVLTPEERRLAEVRKIEREIAVERALAEVRGEAKERERCGFGFKPEYH